MFQRSALILSAVLLGGIGIEAQNAEPRIWQGVYTAAQAERGKTSYNGACLRCHGADLTGTTAPPLAGERFHTAWGGEVIASLFAKIRDTMPPNFGTSIDDQTKLDIVAYILQTNGYPTGSGELALTGKDLASAQIVKKGETTTVQNFSLIQTVGCLTRGPGNTWVLAQTADPVTTREDVSSSQTLAAAARQTLGTRTFRLLSAVPFSPESHQGHKMEARGLIYNEPGDERITLTSLQMAGSCS
jgi:S-disulfanyl-L-cysteine oxidoreductase SoxD